MSKEKKNEAMEEDCGGLKPFNPITKKVKYVEPVSYFSEETRKMFGLGEFAKDVDKGMVDADWEKEIAEAEQKAKKN